MTTSRNNRAGYPLTQTQTGIYAGSLGSDSPSIYHISFLIYMPDAEASRLAAAVDRVAEAYPVLGASIRQDENGVPVMVPPAENVATEVVTCGEKELMENQAALVEPFDLDGGRLARFKVYDIGKKVYLLLDIHHSIFDGASHKVFMAQLYRAYNGEPLDKENISAFGLCEREVGERASEALDNDREVYRTRLEGNNPQFDIMADTKGDKESYQAVKIPLGIDGEAYKAWCRKEKFPQSIPATAAMSLALRRYYRRKDLTFATIWNGRREETAGTIGMLVKTLPVRTPSGDPDMTVRDYMTELARQQKDFRSHTVYSFADAARDFGVNSDFLFGYQGDFITMPLFNGKPVTCIELPKVATGENISAEMFLTAEGAEMHVSYRDDKFSDSLMASLVGNMASILKRIMATDGAAVVSSLTAPDEEERETMLRMGRGGVSSADKADTIPAIFHRTAMKFPAKDAVVYDGIHLSYHDLDRITDTLAHHLVENAGVKPGDFVGVMIDRSELMALYPLAVMKAGAAYMPLDPHFPQDRLEFMTEDAGIKIILDEDGLVAEKLPGFKGTTVSADIIGTLPRDAEPVNLSTPDSPMVILYTSGSTGKPKGVMMRQSNIVNFCAAYVDITNLESSDITGAYAAFGFDAHMLDLYPAFQTGASVHIFTPETRLDLTAMHDYIERNHLTVLFMTTQIAWQMATLFDFPEVRLLGCGGEKLPPIGDLPYRFINLYGPTECSVIATSYEPGGPTDGSIIGSAIPGYEVRILDADMNPSPVGVPGELVIMGRGVADGYLNREDLTAEKFIEIDGVRAYRTGDQARYNSRGEIEFLGRLDGLVKLRGLRIELGEIEAVAAAHPAVKSFVAVVKTLGGMENLVGYYTLRDGAALSADELREFMAGSLTEFMLPSVLMELQELPMTPNGKVDRRALPEPEVEQREIVEASTDTERKVMDVVADVVGNSDFGVTTNLVSVGLTSLLAMRLVAALIKATGVKLTTRGILSDPTVRQIAAAVDAAGSVAPARQDDTKPKRKFYPLTENQRGVYIDWEMNREALQYNIPQAFLMGEGTDAERLRDALLAAVKAHPGVMTRLSVRNGDVVQIPSAEMPQIDIIPLDKEPDAAFFQSLVRPFNILEEPLFRCTIYTYGDRVYMMRDTHHIIFDGVSAMVFNSDMVKAYGGSMPEAEEFSALDQALVEKDMLESEEFDKAQEWFDTLIGESEPTSYPKSAVPDNDISGGMGRISLKADASAIRAFCKKGGITQSNCLLASFLQLMHRLTREKTVQITTINNGRNDIRLLGDTGMFVKTLPVVSTTPDLSESPLVFAERIQKQFLRSQDNDFYPFTSLVERKGVRPEIMFVYEGGIALDDKGSALKMESIGLSLDTAKVPLTLLVFEPSADEYEYVLEYDTSLYNRADMELLLRMMRTLSESAAQASSLRDCVMTDAAQEEELAGIRNGESGPVEYSTFHGAMEAWSDRTPDVTALVACDRRLSYREFDDECNRIANALIKRGVERGDRIVILLPRRASLITSIYGAMKTGSAYIPCAPDYPADRIKLITEDSGARYIITTADRKDLYPGKALDVEELLKETDTCRPQVDCRPEDVAYMIYTSGSTGRPKGVMIPQRAITNYLYGYYREFYQPNPDIKVNMLIVTISFDASLVDLGTSLTSGHTLVLANEEECKDVGLLAELMLRENVDAADVTPSRLDAMLDLPEFAKAVSRCKLLNIGGEGFKISLIDKLCAAGFKGMPLNEYGPTECTVGSNHYVLRPGGMITAGPPFYNEWERIVDAWGGELPVGAVGELYIFGRSVGLGYNNLPEKTAEAFVDYKGERGYRTGDLARWTPEGNVTILGRIDHQVKLRGLRIELGEIESTALQFEGIRMAAADVKEINKIQHLCLYFTAEHEIDAESLREHLAKTLTEYMVPDSYMQMESLPLTPNGKINRKGLPLPEIGPVTPYVEPEGELEKEIAAVFGRILDNDHVGANDDFFSIGGTSISAIKVVAALGAGGNAVSYKQVFAARTPRALAALINGDTKDTEPAAVVMETTERPVSEFADVLDRNTLEAFREGDRQTLGNVLLTGATGFMGIHMLREILDTTDSNVTCMLRAKGGLSPESRLRTLLFYYFDETFADMFSSGRIRVIEGDVTDPVPESLDGAIDTVVNCAANVKHFSAGNDIELVNVESVRNIIAYCLRNGSRLVHISTVSVAGESVNGVPDPDLLLTEHMLDFGQVLSNQYVHSKYNAEHLILTAIRNEGLNAKIMRVGNLSARASDGEFQINFRSNAFMGRLRAYVALGCAPYDALDAPCEFSPIDEVCHAIMLLASTPRDMVVFQPTNNHRIPLGDVLHILNESSLTVETVEPEVFARRINEALADPERVDALQPLLAYDSDNKSRTLFIRYDAEYTNQILYRLGFRWNYTSDRYVERFIKAIEGLNFFTL